MKRKPSVRDYALEVFSTEIVLEYPNLNVPAETKVDQTQLKIYAEIEAKFGLLNAKKRPASPSMSESGPSSKRVNSDPVSGASSKRVNSNNESTGQGSTDSEGRQETAGGKKKSSIEVKLEAAAPYNFLLTKVKDNPVTHKAQDSVYIADLLHPSLGPLASSLQINFMVDLEWMMMNYEVTKTERLPLVLLYGAENPELSSPDLCKVYPNLRAVRIKSKYPYGTHHTKMMVLLYQDGGLRVVVHTANLVPSDWENRTQGKTEHETQSVSTHLFQDSGSVTSVLQAPATAGRASSLPCCGISSTTRSPQSSSSSQPSRSATCQALTRPSSPPCRGATRTAPCVCGVTGPWPGC